MSRVKTKQQEYDREDEEYSHGVLIIFSCVEPSDDRATGSPFRQCFQPQGKKDDVIHNGDADCSHRLRYFSIKKR